MASLPDGTTVSQVKSEGWNMTLFSGSLIKSEGWNINLFSGALAKTEGWNINLFSGSRRWQEGWNTNFVFTETIEVSVDPEGPLPIRAREAINISGKAVRNDGVGVPCDIVHEKPDGTVERWNANVAEDGSFSDKITVSQTGAHGIRAENDMPGHRGMEKWNFEPFSPTLETTEPWNITRITASLAKQEMWNIERFTGSLIKTEGWNSK